MSDLRQKMQAASPEEREKLQKQMQRPYGQGGNYPGQGRGGDAQGGARGGAPGARRGVAITPAAGALAARVAAPSTGDDVIAQLLRRASNVGGYTDEDRKNAKLPLPPEQDSQVQLLLRPGLLADVEIQVEKLPDVIHVPAQAVFQKNGQFLVYVHGKNGKFEPRPVQLVKQSESMMVIASGVQAGEIVAMADPTADKKKNGDKKSQGCGGNAMGGMGGGQIVMGLSNIGPELLMGMASLFAHKLRSLLTMLGMIFGVGAVVAMLSITAGAQKEMMSFIDQLGVNNIIVEAHEAVDRNELQTVRSVSPGLSFRDFRAISENVSGLVAITPRKRFKPQKLLPKTNQEQPQLIGVYPNFVEINSLKLVQGRFFTEDENTASAPVCVLGETTKVNLLGYDNAIGKYVKVNDTWLQVIGVLTPQATSDTDVEGVQAMNQNNLIISPLNTVMRRFEDNTSYLKDEIDGIYMKVGTGVDSIETSNVVRAILAATHKDAGDFTVVVPAGLLEERRRTSVHFRNRHDLYRRYFAPRRRHRHYEHHAGHGLGAHPGNRHSPRYRCTPGRYRASVPDGGGADLHRRRFDRHRVRLHAVARHRVRGRLVYRRDHVIHRGGVRRLGFYWVIVRNLSGRAGRETGSH